MLRCVGLLALLVSLTGAASLTAESCDYFTLGQYHQAHPEQAQKEKSFAERVRVAGVPVPAHLRTPPLRVAVIYPGQQVSDYWRRSVTSFRERMGELQLPLQLEESYSRPVEDLRIQEQQIRQALTSDPDYLVFTLDARKHKRLIGRLLERGRPRILLQNITTPLRSWEGNQPLLYVGFDHATGSRMLAEHFLRLTGGTGSYGLLYFSQGYVSDQRGRTFSRILRKRSRIQRLAAYYTDAKPEKVEGATRNLLSGEPRPDFLFACSTDVALQASRVIEEVGLLGEVAINGWGGGSNELQALVSGKLDVTVMRMNDDNGVAMAEAIRLDREGRAGEIPTVFSGEMVLVEKGISPEALAELEARAFRYSGRQEGAR